MSEIVTSVLSSNGLIVGFCFSAVLLYLALWLSKLSKGRIHYSAIAIAIALILAGIGGLYTGGSKGLADIGIFGGLSLFGGSMMRDFAIVSTVFGAKLEDIKKCGFIGVISILIGVLLSFLCGVAVALAFGYSSAEDIATIGAGVVTFIVGPVTGGALGVDSTVIAIAIAAGLVKSILTMLATPLVAKRIGLTTPKAAMIFGGLLGTTSGVSAALAATDEKLVPYGAMTATFYTGTGCLLCPTVLYGIVRLVCMA